MSSPKNLRPFPSVSLRLLICSVMIIGVGILTATAHSLMQGRVQTQTDIKFAEITDSYVRQISEHIEGSSNLLYAMRGLFAANAVDADAWERFIKTQHSFDRYPGMKVIGYAEVVEQSEKSNYIARLRQGLQLPTASIYPTRTQGEQVPLTYLQESKPATPRNVSAYGFDLASEPLRRQALEQARASGGITATAPLALVPTDKLGFLLTMPLSDHGAVVSGTNQITGYGVAAFDVDLLMNTILGDRLKQYKSSMAVTDVSGPEPLLLYRKTIETSGRKVVRDVTLQVANRTWRITFQTPASTLLMVTDRFAPLAVLIGGIVIILAVGVLFYTLRLRNKLRCMIIS